MNREEKHRKSGIKSKRILIALYYYHPYVSGVSVYAKRIAEGMADRGHEVTVLTSRHDTSTPQEEIINGVRILRRPVLFKLNKGVIMPTFWLDIARLSRQFDFVNIHLPMAEAGLATLFIPTSKLFTTYHCDVYLGAGVLDRAVTLISNLSMHAALSRSEVIIPSSKDYFIHSKMKRYLSKIKPIYPAVPDSEFHQIDSTDLFRSLGIEDRCARIGFVGRIVYEKGISYLLDSIPELDESIGDYKIILVGDYEKIAGGSIKDQLDRYTELYPEKIIFTGYLSDTDRNKFFSGIDVLVLPSMDPLEAFGMVQVEAMLCGTPVVASDLPGVREIIRRTGYGRISNIKDPTSIAREISEVILNREKYTPVREEVVKIFGYNRTIDDYENLLR